MSNYTLEHDHTEIDEALASAFEAIAAKDIERTYESLDLFYGRLAMHIRAENVHLLPTLLEVAAKADEPITPHASKLEAVQATIKGLRQDHDYFMSEMAGVLKHLRDFKREKISETAEEVLASVDKRVNEVNDRLQKHNDLEESQVYHWAGVLLSEDAQRELGEKIQKELDNLPARFRKKD